MAFLQSIRSRSLAQILNGPLGLPIAFGFVICGPLGTRRIRGETLRVQWVRGAGYVVKLIYLPPNQRASRHAASAEASPAVRDMSSTRSCGLFVR